MSRGNRRRWSVRLTRWHRWAGITAALFVIVLAVTGIALQHAPRLGLDRTPVGSTAVARALGIEAGTLRGFRVDGRWIVGSADALFLGRRRVAALPGPPTGALAGDVGLVVTAGGDVLLLGSDGRLLEHLRATGSLPGPVERLGRTPDGAIVAATPERRYRPQRGWLGFTPYDGEVAQWSRPESVPRELAAALEARILGRAVTWERLLLAVHSGRIGGTVGVLLMDAAAVLLLVLAGTGLYLWWRRR